MSLNSEFSEKTFRENSNDVLNVIHMLLMQNDVTDKQITRLTDLSENSQNVLNKLTLSEQKQIISFQAIISEYIQQIGLQLVSMSFIGTLNEIDQFKNMYYFFNYLVVRVIQSGFSFSTQI